MPSPLGHALIGLSAGWLAAPEPPDDSASDCRTPSRGRARFLYRFSWPLAFAAAGMAPDLDLLVGLHSRYTHSIGAALLVFAAAWFSLRRRHARPARAALALALAYGSHVLLDWLASDTNPPIGIMALWPFSNGFYLSPVTIFMGISRKYWLQAAWAQNAVSVAWELLIILPVTALALFVRRAASSRLAPPAPRPSR